MSSNLVTTEAIQQLVLTLSDKAITPNNLSKAFFQTKAMSKYIKKLDDIARDRTLDLLKSQGEKFGAGSLRMDVDGLRLEAITTGSGYDDKKVEALLRTKGLDPTSGMDATITYKTNIEKLCRVLNDNELSACKKEQDYRVNGPKPLNGEDNE